MDGEDWMKSVIKDYFSSELFFEEIIKFSDGKGE